MIGLLAKLAIRAGVPARAAKLVAWALVVLAIAGITAAAVAWIYGSGRTAGGDQVRAAGAEKRDQVLTEARGDERTAVDVARAIDARTARAEALTDAQLHSTIEEIRNAIDTVPPAPDGADLPAAPVDGVRDALNASIARANRAGEDPAAVR
ncbi:hypothetical protein [Sphingomonas sp. ABOLF]|uniref:hypothetical protein n=1 Tax=Sphingomonas sp. ABOLF TaxID=1985879 RepID=UPI000F7DE393|nr:hypothetical protein [Sphingomonas sp. ABOLF]